MCTQEELKAKQPVVASVGWEALAEREQQRYLMEQEQVCGSAGNAAH